MTRQRPAYRVLVVDDDAESAEELAELLESHGVVARTAISAEVARAKAAAFVPDVAVIDLQLGCCSGAELAAGWHGRGGPRVILLSGRALNPAERLRFGEAMPPLLAKPVDIAELVRLVFS